MDSSGRRKKQTRLFAILYLISVILFVLTGLQCNRQTLGPVLFRLEPDRLDGMDGLSGDWQSRDGQVIQEAALGTSFLLTSETDWNNYSASVRLRLPEQRVGAEAGLVFHFADQQDFLVLSLQARKGGSFVVLRKATAKPGLSLVADQQPLEPSLSDWNELRVDVHGAEVSCYVNGFPGPAYLFEGTPPDYNSHGKTWDSNPVVGRVGLFTQDSAAEYEHFQVRQLNRFEHIVTPQRGRHDQQGRLLPRQSYAETMSLFSEWLYSSGQVVDASEAPISRQNDPPYLLTNFVTSGDKLLGVGGEFAFNHAMLISGAVQYYIYSGQGRYLDLARNVADWEIRNSTPEDWALPHLPPSFVKFNPDGSWQGLDWGLEPDKSAYVGLAYLKLYAATKQTKYLEAAVKIAETLEEYQSPEGNWPFRINAQTGEVKEGYTCSQLWYVWFFENLSQITGEKRYMQRRDRAFQWLLENPVRTDKWLGLYGDIVSGAESYDQWVALETAMYLIDRREENPDYVRKAQSILDWVNRVLVVDYGFHPGVPGVVEQSQYKVVLTHHELRLAEVYAKLWEATGVEDYKRRAIEIANSVTWCMMSDGKIRQGFWYHAWGIPLILSFNDQFSRLMSSIPETAQQDENHLLQTTSFVNGVRYWRRAVEYETQSASYDRLVVGSAPVRIISGGNVLMENQNPRSAENSWRYDSRTGLLEINHRDTDVKVFLE